MTFSSIVHILVAAPCPPDCDDPDRPHYQPLCVKYAREDIGYDTPPLQAERCPTCEALACRWPPEDHARAWKESTAIHRLIQAIFEDNSLDDRAREDEEPLTGENSQP